MNTEYIKTVKEHIWNYLVNKKVFKKSRIWFIFEILQSGPLWPWWQLCTLLASLCQLHEVVTWNGFQWTREPCQESMCGMTCLLNWEHQLCWAEVGLVHSGKLYLTAVVIHIMARSTQLSEEKRQPILTLRTEGQSIRNMSRTLNV